MLQTISLNNLSLDQLYAIEQQLDSYLFKQPDHGEPIHPSYKKNKQSFALLVKHQVQLKRIVHKFYKAQITPILNRLSTTYPIIADEKTDRIKQYISDHFNTNANIDLANSMSDAIFPSYENGAKATAQELKIGTLINSTNAPAQKFLTNYTLKLAGNLNKTTVSDVQQAISTSIGLGESQSEAATRINDILDDPDRAEMIARTEVLRAFTQGRLDVGQEMGYEAKQWSNGQPGACEWCADLDGTILPIDEQFVSGNDNFAPVDGPPLHPNCYCGTPKLIKSLDEVEAKEQLQGNIKAGWITKDGRHIYIDDEELNRMDYSHPTRLPTDKSFGRYDAEHMIKYNAALQADNDRIHDPTIPENIKDLIYNADVGGSAFPKDMAASILRNLPGDLSNNLLLQKTLTNWGRSAQMVWESRNRLKK